MDTVKQALMGIIGSMALGGCLTDPNVIQVPDTQQEEAAQNGDTGGTASAWPATRLPAGPEPRGDRFDTPAGVGNYAFCVALPDVDSHGTPAAAASPGGALA